ncbi:MAG: DUF2752 domain-containing protein [Lachnospiraceae bacterium]
MQKAFDENTHVQKNRMRLAVLLLLAAGLLMLVLLEFVWYRLGVPCILYTYTGFYCPGCGGTRAVHYLLEGRILLSFIYHPLVLYSILVPAAFVLTNLIDRLSGHKLKIGMKYHDRYLYIALLLILVNWIVKNILLHAAGIAL